MRIFLRIIGASLPMLIALAAFSFNPSAAQGPTPQASPSITDVKIARRANGTYQARVTGSGFIKDDSVVEINGVQATKTKSLSNGAASDGSPTRLRASDDRLQNIVESRVQAVFHVLNLSSGQRSSPYVFNNEPPPVSQIELTRFAEIGGSPDIYHMTEAPDRSYVVTQFRSSSLVELSSTGSIIRTQRGSFIFPTSIAFYTREVAFTSCNPGPLASRGFGSDNFGREGVPPGNIGGVSNPRYLLGEDGLISRTFFLSNGGTGEIRRVDPSTRTITTIAGGFTRAAADADARGPEQLAYNRKTATLYALDSGRGALISIDVASGRQTMLRAGLNYPFGLVLLPSGNLLISNRGDGTLMQLTAQGELAAAYDTKLGENALRGLFVNSRGEIFLLADKTQTIFRVRL